MKTGAEVRSRPPTIRQYFPDWWHHHGRKMRVTQLDEGLRRLVFSASAAKITIFRPLAGNERGGWKNAGSSEEPGWIVEWEVILHKAHEEVSRGRRHFSKAQLAAAFGLSLESGDYGQWLLDRYGADSAEQALYIRWGRFLNIPCPGTGHDGDPNVSIELDEEHYHAVCLLLAAK